MKKSRKRGFTIVELVVIIAVIAILAAILIPTFAGITEKANLSADKQAVRQMNEALAEWEAANGYKAKPADVESAMNILEQAGFNAENQVCLSQNYQVWWSKEYNRCVLYNAYTGKVEYPNEYTSVELLKAETGWYIYNANHITAQQFDLKLGSASGATGITSFINATSKTDPSLIKNQTNNLTKIDSIISSRGDIREIVVGSTEGNVNVFATKEKVSAISGSDGNIAYVSLQVSSVSGKSTPVTVKDSITGEEKLAENFYYLTIVKEGNPGVNDVSKAEAAAGQFVYNIFDQITTGKIPDNATIIIDTDGGEVTLDVSASEWAPCKTFTGYFGTSNASNKIVIDGARLTSLTGVAHTVQFRGSKVTIPGESTDTLSSYFVTGFFGTIYGNTTIENVKFKDLTIVEPAKDLDAYTRGADNRNTIGIIGGIVDTGNLYSDDSYKANVVLKNIIVESSCSITGCSSAGGLVGYIGGAGEGYMGLTRNLVGEILIENCEIYADVTSTNTKTHTNYNPVGGIIGFTTRNGFKKKSGTASNYALNSEGKLITDTKGDSDTLLITIRNCTYAGKLTGNNAIGVVFGDVLKLPDTITTITIDGGSFEGATFASTVDSDRVAALAATTQGADLTKIVIKENLTTDKIVSSYPALVTTKYDKGTHTNKKYNLSKEIIN